MGFYKYSIEYLQNMAEDLAFAVKPPFSFLLDGDLGTGKTMFAQFFIRKIFVGDVVVTSPTFNIMQNYQTSKGCLWHVDLYRLENEFEIFELGLLELMTESICLIEWPFFMRKYITNDKFLEINF